MKRAERERRNQQMDRVLKLKADIASGKVPVREAGASRFNMEAALRKLEVNTAAEDKAIENDTCVRRAKHVAEDTQTFKQAQPPAPCVAERGITVLAGLREAIERRRAMLDTFRERMLAEDKRVLELVAQLEGEPANPSKPVLRGHCVLYRERECKFKAGNPFKLFKYLLDRAGQSFSYAELRTEVWGPDSQIEDNTVQQGVCTIRKVIASTKMKGIEIERKDKQYRLLLS